MPELLLLHQFRRKTLKTIQAKNVQRIGMILDNFI